MRDGLEPGEGQMSALSEWQNFYVIVGSSAGALIGLQFVVLALVANMRGTQPEGGQAFITPTIVHFGTALLLAGVMAAPWRNIVPVALLWVLTGVAGVIYTDIVARRMRAQTVYRPQWEDWLFHAILPSGCYGVLIVTGCIAPLWGRAALFGTAGATLLLLFVGIHNAWDTVTYHVFTK